MNFREKYETLVEKEARKSQLNGVGHNHSRDSAIDADLQEWETESQEIEIVRKRKFYKFLFFFEYHFCSFC